MIEKILTGIQETSTIEELPDTITDLEKFVQLCSDLYDKENDSKLLEELRQILKEKNDEAPSSSNQRWFITFYNAHILAKKSLEHALVLDQSSSLWFRQKYAVVRVFKNDNERFMISRELRNAFNVAMMNKFKKILRTQKLPMEKQEEIDLGIMKAVKWEELDSYLIAYRLTIANIRIIHYDLAKTSRGTPVPINTPLGTYCTLAKHAFWNIFERIILEVGPVSKENYTEIFEWFAQFDDVFNNSCKCPYFIETWKTDEIIDKAYQDIINEMQGNEETLEDMNIIKYRFLEQVPKYIRFLIDQCFYPMALKIDLIVAKHEKVFMRSLSIVRYINFISRFVLMQEMGKELAEVMVECSNYGYNYFKLLKFENQYLTIVINNGEAFIRKRVFKQAVVYSPQWKNCEQVFDTATDRLIREASKKWGNLVASGEAPESLESCIAFVGEHVLRNITEEVRNANSPHITKQMVEIYMKGMNITHSQPRWTPEGFENLVGKLVHRTKFTQNFRDELLKIDREAKLSIEDGCKLLKILFEDSKRMKNLYGSPEELMHDLEVLQNFSNNSEFLGYPKDQANYLAEKIQMKDTEGIEFCSKIEAFEDFHKSQKLCSQKKLILKSIGNRLAREMKDSFELIPTNLFEERIILETSKYIWNFNAIQKLPDTITDFEKFCKLCSELYDKKHDKELLEELRQISEQKNDETPFSSNQDLFIDFYISQVYLKYGLEHALGFNQSSSHWFRRTYPVVRVFKNDNERFMMSKELENALNAAMMNKFGRQLSEGLLPMETAKDRQAGIVRAVEWEDLDNILADLGLSIHDIHIINYDLAQTSRDTPVPINTPYGTYCTLAKHAFWSVFERIILEVGPVSEENYSKIFKWFAQFDDVFSNSCEYRYFVETWRTDKIMDKAYREIISEMPRNKNKPLEDMNIIKEGFLGQNPKFIQFVINQGICVRPGRFFDLVKKINDPKAKLDLLVVKQKEIFMRVLPMIPDNEFVSRSGLIRTITEELSKDFKLEEYSYIDINSYKLYNFQSQYLDTEQRNGEHFIRRKRVCKEAEEDSPQVKNFRNFMDIATSRLLKEGLNEWSKLVASSGASEDSAEFVKKYVLENIHRVKKTKPAYITEQEVEKYIEEITKVSK